MNNYELHMKVHTCHDNCQNPICIAVRKAVEAEREECAHICDNIAIGQATGEGYDAAFDCGFKIRARGSNV